MRHHNPVSAGLSSYKHLIIHLGFHLICIQHGGGQRYLLRHQFEFILPGRYVNNYDLTKSHLAYKTSLLLLLGATQMYNFPEELREVVNDHWSQFPPQHPLVADIFGILFLVLTVVNFTSNFLVIYVYLGTEELRTPVSYYETLFENYTKCPIVIL